MWLTRLSLSSIEEVTKRNPVRNALAIHVGNHLGNQHSMSSTGGKPPVNAGGVSDTREQGFGGRCELFV